MPNLLINNAFDISVGATLYFRGGSTGKVVERDVDGSNIALGWMQHDVLLMGRYTADGRRAGYGQFAKNEHDIIGFDNTQTEYVEDIAPRDFVGDMEATSLYVIGDTETPLGPKPPFQPCDWVESTLYPPSEGMKRFSEMVCNYIDSVSTRSWGTTR